MWQRSCGVENSHHKDLNIIIKSSNLNWRHHFKHQSALGDQRVDFNAILNGLKNKFRPSKQKSQRKPKFFSQLQKVLYSKQWRYPGNLMSHVNSFHITQLILTIMLGGQYGFCIIVWVIASNYQVIFFRFWVKIFCNLSCL